MKTRIERIGVHTNCGSLNNFENHWSRWWKAQRYLSLADWPIAVLLRRKWFSYLNPGVYFWRCVFQDWILVHIHYNDHPWHCYQLFKSPIRSIPRHFLEVDFLQLSSHGTCVKMLESTAQRMKSSQHTNIWYLTCKGTENNHKQSNLNSNSDNREKKTWHKIVNLVCLDKLYSSQNPHNWMHCTKTEDNTCKMCKYKLRTSSKWMNVNKTKGDVISQTAQKDLRDF